MKAPLDLKYTRNHEWVRIEQGSAWVGLTDHAQEELGDIVFVELPEVGTVLQTGAVLGVVESVKSASDVYTPVGGIVAETNPELADVPEKINQDAFAAWMIRLEQVRMPDHAADLMDAESYIAFCEEES